MNVEHGLSRREDIFLRNGALGFAMTARGLVSGEFQDRLFGTGVGIGHAHMHQKAIQLRFG